jgi:hypothetical protein
MAGLNQPARVWVNRPSPTPHSPLSHSPSSPLATGSPPPSLADSGGLRWVSLPPPWAKHAPPRPLPLHRVDSTDANSTRRSGWFYPSGSAASPRLRLDASSSLLVVCAEQPLVLALHKHPPVSALTSSLHPLLLSMAMLSDPLVKNIELSSQSLLCAAANWCRLDSISCTHTVNVMNCWFLNFHCQHPHWQRCCFWTLHTCRVQLTLV